MTTAELDEERVLLDIARNAITSFVRGARAEAHSLPAQTSRGVFVTLWTPKGELRGCIGHIQPYHQTLAEEIVSCAVSSASQDPRFPPVRSDEIDGLTVEISLLGETEPVSSLTALDPRRWGVVVECGRRCGVLLPAIDGVETVEQQLSIALRKGSIRSDEPWTVSRFEVKKISERAHVHRS